MTTMQQRRREMKERPTRLAAEDFRASDRAGEITRPVTIVGQLVGFSEAGIPLVDYAGRTPIVSAGVEARTTVPLDQSQVGSEVVLLLAGKDAAEPIVMGCILPPAATELGRTGEASVLDAQLNGQRLELTAQDELVLRCGNSSITLTKAGKVLIRGAYLLSRSSGVNRIKGGSVQIN